MSNRSEHQRTTRAPAPLAVPLWDEAATADALGVKVRTIQAWRVRGGGPPFVKMGALVRYRPEAVAAWVEACTIESTSGSPAAA
ncbi:helix-turn-helix domain-containing protein [uncultured Thiodictyon sp.]|uniref:helix-turn-helix transcriptional regulator n=1 Tax=uncultured Thiodictyon sp. TaxID=1846217 RepID=UPI0025FE9C24|nr:helix-turn-helix domain-containing protein [uncultured Thiodictyon sp.]